jgi:hypothetical protein
LRIIRQQADESHERYRAIKVKSQVQPVVWLAEFLRGLAIFGRIWAANSGRPKILPVVTTPNHCNAVKKYK